MFARFFKPKWQHRNPTKRCEAIAVLHLDDPALLTLARHDQVAEVRKAAISKLTEIEVLGEIAETEPHTSVGQHAAARLEDLVCGRAKGAPALNERLHFLAHKHVQRSIAAIARQGKETELRSAAIARLNSPQLLMEIALQDPIAEVRLEATKYINDLELLDRVIKGAKKSDKRVVQCARQRLTQMRTHNKAVQRLEARIQELQTLCLQGSFTDRQSTLLKVEQERTELAEVLGEKALEPLDAARLPLKQRCDQYRELKVKKQRACEILEQIAQKLDHEEELDEAWERHIQMSLAEAKGDWNTAGTLEEIDGKPLAQRYRWLTEHVAKQQDQLKDRTQAAQGLREFLDRVERGIDEGQFATKQSIAKLLDDWEQLSKLGSTALSQAFAARFHQLHTCIEAKREQVAQQLSLSEQELAELCESLRQAVTAGQLKTAVSLRDQIRHRLERSACLPAPKRRQFEQSLKQAAPSIKELQSWRTWGASGVRARLCEQAEELQNVPISPHRQAQQIRELRTSWKRLDKQSGPADDALWQRFNTACNRAYEPCHTAFAEEAQQRKHNLVKKQDICNRLEQLTSQIKAEQVDWSALLKNYNKLLQAWRQAGPINKAHAQGTLKRFNQVRRNIDIQLNNQRQAGLRYRQQLIERVQQLADEESDLALAIDQAKRAQAEWNTVVVRSTRKTEEALWKSFRAACDKIFQRREAETQAREQILADNTASKSKLCDALDAHIQQLNADNWQTTLQAVDGIKQHWVTIEPIPGLLRVTLEKRFQAGLNALAAAVHHIQRQRTQRLWSALQKRACGCEELEALLDQSATSEVFAEIHAIQSAWEDLPAVEEAFLSGVQIRFDRALSTLESRDPQARDAAIRQLRAAAGEKHRQCLEMEVLAGIDSPPEYTEQRMQLKVTQLSERFDGRSVDGHNAQALEADDLTSHYQVILDAQQRWIESGMLPADEMQALEHRFEIAANALLAAS